MNAPIRRLIIGFTLLLLVAGSTLVAQADPEQEFEKREEQLNRKAGEVKTLADELALLDATVVSKTDYITELTVKATKARQELAAINEDLTNMQRQRGEAERTLNRYVRADYVQRLPNQYLLLAGEQSLSESMADQSYLGSLQSFADRMVNKMVTVEDAVGGKQSEAQENYLKLDALERKLEREAQALAAVRAQKQQLLSQTQGQEALFRQQFEETKAQLDKMGLFACGSERPSRTWDETNSYFNQLDTRWKDTKLGFSSSSTLGCYGCGVASLAMVFKQYGIDTNPPQLNGELKKVRAFVNDLLDWRNVAAASGGRLALANNPYPLGRDRVDWGLIDRQLESGNPAIVYIDRQSDVSHYVVLTAKRNGVYLMNDPIEGPNLRFSDYYRQDAVYQFITFRRT